MRRIGFIFTCLFVLIAFVQAKTDNGYAIDITAPQSAGEPVFLAGYFNGKVYKVDSTNLNSKGKGVLTKKKALDEGLYLVYFSPSRYYEMLVGAEQKITVRIDTTSAEKKFIAAGAPQTEAFESYANYMMQKQKQQKALIEEIEAAKGDATKEDIVKEKMKKLDEEVQGYQKSLAAQYKGQIFGLFVKTLITPQYPKELIGGDPNDKNLAIARYQYAKNHYWDNFDLGDRRSWRLNILNRSLDEFTGKILFQIPDSIIPEAINLIERSKKDSICFELMTNYMMNLSVQSKVMGMDKLLVTLADKYYFSTPKQAFWADSTLMKNISSEVKKIRYNLIGMTAANLALTKYDGTRFNLFDVKAPITLLYFFEPSCGHCKHTTPLIHEVYEKYKDKGFQVICIYNLVDKKEWTEFLDAHKLNDWINAWDPMRESYYWQFFDVSTTPGVFLLDKDKKIIAKKIDEKTLEMILQNELK